jgi:hypothetical protein
MSEWMLYGMNQQAVFDHPSVGHGAVSPGSGAVTPTPSAFYVFDRAREPKPYLMNQRVHACYHWARASEYRVVDEFIAWGTDALEPFPELLTEAIGACQTAGVSLLVHDTGVIGDAKTIQEVVTRLGDLQLWALFPTPGPITVDDETER